MYRYALLLQSASSDDGLTLAEILRDIPHDVPALVVYVLVGVSIAVVIRTGRSGRRGPDGAR